MPSANSFRLLPKSQVLALLAILIIVPSALTWKSSISMFPELDTAPMFLSSVIIASESLSFFVGASWRAPILRVY